MPLKGVNSWVGEGAVDHWWFLQWEKKGDAALRYFLEPCVLTANWAKAQGYQDLYMAGLSGGGWSTTFAAAIDTRINASFPVAGSTPCGLRDPNHMVGRPPSRPGPRAGAVLEPQEICSVINMMNHYDKLRFLTVIVSH